jgi:hypothetical protein
MMSVRAQVRSSYRELTHRWALILEMTLPRGMKEHSGGDEFQYDIFDTR